MTTGPHRRLDPDELASSVALEDIPDEPAPPERPMSTATRQRLARAAADHVVAVGDGEVADGPTEVAGWELLQGLRAEVAEAKQDAETALASAKAVKRKLDRATNIVYAGAGLIGIGALAVLKLAVASGDKTATDRQINAERIELRAAVRELQLVTIPEIRAVMSANMANIAGLRGSLDAISRLGAVRVQGPAPQPLLPGDP